MADINGGQPVVVGLGPVDPALVTEWLGDDVRLVTDPSAADLAEAQGAIVRAAYVVDRAALDAMPALKVIARTGVGVDRVDVAAATERGIPVAITPRSNARAVAEGAITLAAALVKRVPQEHRLVSTGQWGTAPIPTPGDLLGSRLGVVGYGRIGRIVAQLGQALGFEVSVHDPYIQADDLPNRSLAELVAESDVLTLHVPETDRPLLDRDLLWSAKPGQVLINCSRAGLVDIDLLDEALEAGVLGGVGLDVFASEPAPHHPVFDRDNVLVSPHVTGLSVAASEATFRMAAQAVAAVIAGGRPEFAVNAAELVDASR
ncbi:hypothetical protein F8O06_09780 [Pseudoclavibacter sp. CFCC 14310]|uniref:NAD(P)-dependent oxidoreductase n=1 Tax=Pseudoclavibacter sp. CFCC 14310 TaxID=2615180 RepID=UPI001300FB4C|nr:NAD(P)-dependent oxidoreductase [Pseudoclavibacter sp. CFCC 14310]KAB1644334.1 hypothetical protein F8O06_09780 [Pseudoclavibacter sp. CFCC 14310]